MHSSHDKRNADSCNIIKKEYGIGIGPDELTETLPDNARL
jgi:hypothetical protein